MTRAAQDATKTIPIVMALSGDPVGAGFVASLVRPGGNITGFTTLVEGLYTKRLQLIREAVPIVGEKQRAIGHLVQIRRSAPGLVVLQPARGEAFLLRWLGFDR